MLRNCVKASESDDSYSTYDPPIAVPYSRHFRPCWASTCGTPAAGAQVKAKYRTAVLLWTKVDFEIEISVANELRYR